MKVALDLEEVLADTISEACRSTDKIDHSDFNSWDLDNYTWQVYSGVSDALWRHDPLSIPTVEPNLAQHVAAIRDNCEQLDIVTARLHVDDPIGGWLAHHGIRCDNLVSTHTPKYELEYDLYIDDNPEMVGECWLLLRDHPHNSQINRDTSKTCNRIHSLEEVVSFLE